MRKYLIVVIALLFSLGITAQTQRKVTTDELQVTKLKNAETIGFDEKGDAFAKAFPKVDLTPINTELAKKLNAGTYTGTASDLHKNMVKSVENTLPDINGNVKLPPSKAFVGFENRDINIEYPHSFDEAFIMRQMRIRPIRFISEDGSEQEMSFTFYAPTGIKPIIYDWKTKQSHFDHDTHHPDDKFKIVNYTAPTLDEVLQSGNISKNEVIIGENSVHPMFNKPHVKIKPGEITIASTSPFGGFVKGVAILTSEVIGGATQKFKLGGIGIPEGTLVTTGYVQNSIATKLNAGTYKGTASDLKAAIDSKVTASGLEKITENGKNGYRLIGKDPNNYGNIGDGAVDFSSQTNANSTRGATGDHSVAIGTDVTASGKYSVAIGKNLKSNLDYSLKIGEGEDLQYAGNNGESTQTRFVISSTNGFTQEATNLFTVDEFGRVFVRKDFSSVCTRNQLMPWGKIQDYVVANVADLNKKIDKAKEVEPLVEGTVVVGLKKHVTIPDGVTEIGAYAIMNLGVSSVTIPNSVTKISTGALNSNRLTSITIPDGVTEIGAYAFMQNKLTSVTLPPNCHYKSSSFDSTVTITGGIKDN